MPTWRARVYSAGLDGQKARQSGHRIGGSPASAIRQSGQNPSDRAADWASVVAIPSFSRGSPGLTGCSRIFTGYRDPLVLRAGTSGTGNEETGSAPGSRNRTVPGAVTAARFRARAGGSPFAISSAIWRWR